MGLFVRLQLPAPNFDMSTFAVIMLRCFSVDFAFYGLDVNPHNDDETVFNIVSLCFLLPYVCHFIHIFHLKHTINSIRNLV